MNALHISAVPQLQVVPDSSQPAHLQPVGSPEEQADQQAEKSDEFWSLWLEHRDYLYRVCLKYTAGNQIDAKELLSQARDKAQAKWPKHAHKVTNPKSWLSSLTRHLYIDLYRSRERKTKLHSGLQKEALGAIAHHPSPNSNLLDSELRAYVYQLISALPPRLRTPVILRFHQEKSYKEIAFQLSISEATVRKRIQQARQKLRKPLRLYLAGLSQATIATDPAMLQTLTHFIEPTSTQPESSPEHSPETTRSSSAQIKPFSVPYSAPYKVTTT
ncbi:MAG: RNA polymerase sigma factor [Cyanobacteria bacterium P01_F01_bin.53]